MSNARTNMAAWLTKVGDKLEVRTASYPFPKEHEVIIKTCAWVINSIDWKLQTIPMFNWLKFPLISGGDIAGEVTEVGSGVTNVKKGDRVLGFASWSSNKPREGGLQDYIAVPMDRRDAHPRLGALFRSCGVAVVSRNCRRGPLPEGIPGPSVSFCSCPI